MDTSTRKCCSTVGLAPFRFPSLCERYFTVLLGRLINWNVLEMKQSWRNRGFVPAYP
jgi:hypothetical protein